MILDTVCARVRYLKEEATESALPPDLRAVPVGCTGTVW